MLSNVAVELRISRCRADLFRYTAELKCSAFVWDNITKVWSLGRQNDFGCCDFGLVKRRKRVSTLGEWHFDHPIQASKATLRQRRYDVSEIRF